jgi:anaerobic C4-dicarboxylate transporter
MTSDWQHTRLVVHGVVAAFVSAAITTLAGIVATPDLGYHQLLHVAITGGIVGCAGYFVKSPVSK